MGAPAPLTLADELVASKPRLVALLVLLAPLVALAASFRLIGLGLHGLDVDEASNLAVALSAFRTGIPSFPPELGATAVPYLSHPAFGYDLISVWFRIAGPTIESARLASALASLVAIVLLAAWFVRHHGVVPAILVSTFVSLDGWIVLTNRSNFLENAQLVPLVVGMWLFARAVRTERMRDFALAGLALGVVVVFKHIGAYVAIAVVLDWLVARRSTRGYALLLAVLGLVLVGYVVWMDQRFGGLYSANQAHQVQRVLGIVPAPGQNIGAGDVAGAVIERYFIFLSTLVAFVLGIPAALATYGRRLVGSARGRGASDVLLSWAVAGIVAAAASQLKSPHYLILWLLPLYAWLAVAIPRFARGRRSLLVPVLVALFVATNLGTWNLRFAMDHGDALASAAGYIDGALPEGAVVGADPFLGGLLRHRYVRIDREPPRATLARITHFAVYTSRTTTSTRYTPGVATSMAGCRPVAVFTGFKDRVVICARLADPAPRPALHPGPRPRPLLDEASRRERSRGILTAWSAPTRPVEAFRLGTSRI